MIREKDGINIDRGDRNVVLDGRNTSGELNVVSHAHFDHINSGSEEIICSEETAELCKERTGKKFDHRSSASGIELHPSGHVIGSRAVTVEDDGEKILYTGDVSTRDRAYIQGFEPFKADKLVIETTYGLPQYRFPDYRDVEKQVIDFIESEDRPLFLFGYSLGKAQKIQHMLKDVSRELYVHEKIHEMNQIINQLAGLELGSKLFDDSVDLTGHSILLLPSACSRSDWVEQLVEKTGGVKAGFSGWAVNDSFSYRGGYDRTFPLSDHADFDELVKIVEEVDPEKVYTHHGFDEAFAAYLRREKGFDARALKKNQASLNDF